MSKMQDLIRLSKNLLAVIKLEVRDIKKELLVMTKFAKLGDLMYFDTSK